MSAPDSIQVVCPHDSAVNRVPFDRLSQAPRCGKCHEPLFTGEPVDFSTATFGRQFSASQLPLLVDFWAPWCGPCRMMAPAFHKAAGLLEPYLRLAKVNTQDEPDVAGRFNIRSIPTLILFAGGREIARQSGAMTSAEQIAAWARRYVQPA